MQEQDKEREAFNNVLGLLGGVDEKISMTGSQSPDGLVLRLKTEWADLGIPSDGFAHPEIQIRYAKEKSILIYNERGLVVPDFYRACSFLLEDLVAREKGSHRIQLLGHAEHALKKYL